MPKKLDIKIEIVEKIKQKMAEKIEKLAESETPIVHQVYLLSHPACDICLDFIKKYKKQIDSGDIVVLEVTSKLGKKALEDIKDDRIPELVIYVDGKFVKLSEFVPEKPS